LITQTPASPAEVSEEELLAELEVSALSLGVVNANTRLFARKTLNNPSVDRFRTVIAKLLASKTKVALPSDTHFAQPEAGLNKFDNSESFSHHLRCAKLT
jgi:hypothetical protein